MSERYISIPYIDTGKIGFDQTPSIVENNARQEFQYLFHLKTIAEEEWIKTGVTEESDKIDRALDAWRRNRLIPTHAEFPHEMWMLPGTGWNMERQMGLMAYNAIILPRQYAVDTSLKQIKTDIKAFDVEYIYQGLLFPNPLTIQVDENGLYVYSSLYQKKWVDAISEKEREGATKQTAQEIEQFLIDGAPGSMAITISPDGWTGMVDEVKDRPLLYPDCHADMLLKKVDGTIEAFTIRLDPMNLDWYEELLRRFGVVFPDNQENLLPNDRIKQIVRSVAYLPPTHRINSIEMAMDEIARHKGFYAFKGRDFTEIYRDLKHKTQLLQFNDEEKQRVDEFTQRATKVFHENGMTQHSMNVIARGLGETILQIWNDTYGGDKIMSMNQNRYDDQWMRRAWDELKQVGGCGGGGYDVGNEFRMPEHHMPIYKLQSLNLREVVLNLVDEFGTRVFKCASGCISIRPYNQLLTHCPKCQTAVPRC